MLSVSRIFSLSFLAFVALAALVISSCGNSNNSKEYSFERSVQEPVIEKRCLSTETDTTKECYLLKWRNPTDTSNLVRIHIWLDTTAVGLTAESASASDLAQSIVRNFSPVEGILVDSMDLSEELKAFAGRDSVHITLWAEYDDNGVKGRLVRTFVILGDDIPPARVQLTDSATYNTLVLHWVRPIDQTDFYNLDSLNGPIVGYNITFHGPDSSSLLKLSATLRVGGLETPLLLAQRYLYADGAFELLPAANEKQDRYMAIKDGLGFQADSIANVFELVFTGLKPETKYEMLIEAYDSAGNMSESDQFYLSTTDSIAPLKPPQFWVSPDTVHPGYAQLDSNRILLRWPKSPDPLRKSHGITADSIYHIPTSCKEGDCYRASAYYILQRFNGTEWVGLHGAVDEKSVTRESWSLVSGLMAEDSLGNFMGDTLRWVVPGDSIPIRIRAVDSSGGVSLWLYDTMRVSLGVLGDSLQCPAGMVAVHKRAGADVSVYSAFCMERYEHRDSTGFAHNVLFADARATCQAMSDASFSVDLCTNDDWYSSCTSHGSTYGTIQELPFYPSEFLLNYCNQSTGDSSAALSLASRNAYCVSADGVRDLPGQLQEWTLDKDTLGNPRGVFKGSSYLNFGTTDPTLLAKCSATGYPVRWRPRYTTDTVYLYKNGTRLDTVLAIDTSRTLYRTLLPASFSDTLYFYKVSHPGMDDSLGLDYVDAAEYNKRIGENRQKYLDALSNGLQFTPIDTMVVFRLSGTQALPGAANFYRDASIGYRCCARRL